MLTYVASNATMTVMLKANQKDPIVGADWEEGWKTILTSPTNSRSRLHLRRLTLSRAPN